jgi:tetratricopeptide (TPR) repeat protein
MAVKPPRSDVEKLAKTRILIASLILYLLCMAFMALGDRLYGGTDYLLYSRLAVIPFFLLLLRRWQRLVRVRPPPALVEARRVLSLGRHRAAREKFERLERDLPAKEIRRIDRSRRVLQDGLAITVAQEVLLETGRCSLHLGELERAIDELGRAQAQLPRRSDVAIDLAEALSRAGRSEQAARVLRGALLHMDAVDQQTIVDQPALFRLLGDESIPLRSSFHAKIVLERALLALLVVGALAHAGHLYLGLY